MTAAKVMDVIARVPGCAGHAADAVSAGTKNGRRTSIADTAQVRASRHLDTSATTQVAKLMVQR